MKHCAILGSTGSIGTQSLDVVDILKNYQVDILAAHSNKSLLFKQIKKYQPKHVFITHQQTYQYFKDIHSEMPQTHFHYMWDDYDSAIESVDCVIGAISGAAGIEPTLKSLKAGIRVGLANKETMVEAGDLVRSCLEAYGGEIIPVDSEHSAIFQCLEKHVDAVKKIILTASGGPFRDYSEEDFAHITKEQALKHPNWSMGAKITIDSATMMNKGLEVIEAYHLFGCSYEQIEVVVHPESIIHSMVQFVDGAVKAQLGLPDMKVPIQLAFTYPERKANNLPALNVWEIGKLQFFKPRFEIFPAIELAYSCGKRGGSAPIVMNASNEEIVQAFLEDKIRFTEIIPLVAKCVDTVAWQQIESIEHIYEVDREARALAKSLIDSGKVIV